MITASGGDIVEGVPWWWTAIGAPVLGLVVVAIRKWARLGPDHPETPPPSKDPGTDGTAGSRAAPVTPDEKLDATKELILELRQQRNRLAKELEEINERHEQELEAIRVRHQMEMGQLQQRVYAQEEYINRIERLLGMPPGMRPQPPPTPPPTRPYEQR